MAEEKVQLKEVYPVPESVRKGAYIKSRADYEKIYKRSIEDPDGFWGESPASTSRGSRSGTRSRSTTST